VTSIRLLLAPPLFADDEEKTRVASVLNTLLLSLMAAAVAYAVVAPIVATNPARRVLIAGPVILVMPALLLVMRRGYVRLAGVVLNAGLWLIATATVVIAGGVRAPEFGAYLIVVLTSGVLLGWRAALGTAAFSLVAGLALFGATNAARLPTPYYERTNTLVWLIQMVFLLSGTLVICLARRSGDDALRRMREELTERRRAEAALKESEERYARLGDVAFEGIGFCENNIIFDANARLAAMLCYTPDELIGMPTEQLVAPESRDLVRRRVQTRYQAMYEHLAIRKDGSVFPVEVRSRFAQYHGRPIRVIVVRDISERLAAQHALAASELRFRVAFHANPAPQALTHAADAAIIDVNAAFERLSGFPRADLIDRPITDLPLWVAWDREPLLDQLRAQRRLIDRPTQMQTQAGVVRDLILSIEPVRVGDQPCFLSVMIDLTERLAAERALAQSERMFKNLVQSINAVVWEADAVTFQFSFVSEQAEKLLGYPTADWLAVPTFWADHIHPDDRDSAVSYCVRCTQALEQHEFEYRMVAANGQIVWLRDLVTVEVREGQPRTLRGVMVDITARKQVEEEVQLLRTASLAISTAPDLHAALSVALQLVCEATGWVLGQAWMPRADGAVLECSATWWCGIPGLEAFRRHSETITLVPGEGLPGRVWQSKQTAWIQDVTQDGNFPRNAAAREVGLRAAMAFPVLSEAEVVAVLEFFVVEPRVEDARLVKLVSTMAAQFDAWHGTLRLCRFSVFALAERKNEKRKIIKNRGSGS